MIFQLIFISLFSSFYVQNDGGIDFDQPLESCILHPASYLLLLLLILLWRKPCLFRVVFSLLSVGISTQNHWKSWPSDRLPFPVHHCILADSSLKNSRIQRGFKKDLGTSELKSRPQRRRFVCIRTSTCVF